MNTFNRENAEDVYPDNDGRHYATLLPRGWNEQLSENEQELAQFVEEMGDAINDAKISIWKVPLNSMGRPTTRKWSFCLEVGLTDYSFSQLCSLIQSRFGGGEYRLQIRDENNQLKKNKSISIESDERNPVPQQNETGNLFDSFNRALGEHTDRMEYLMRSNQPQQDPMQMMIAMASAMGKMMEVMGVNREPKKSNLEVLQETVLMQKLTEKLGGPGDGDGDINSFWGAISKVATSFGPPLMQAMKMAQQRGQMDERGALLSPPTPEQSAADPAPKSPPKPTPEQMQMLASVKPYLTVLVTQASEGNTPRQSADFMVGNLDSVPEALEALDEFLRTDGIIDICAAVEPGIGHHRQWFEKWHEIMIEKLDEIFVDDADLTADENSGDDSRRLSGEGAAETPPDADDATGTERTRHPDGNPERTGGDAGDTASDATGGKTL